MCVHVFSVVFMCLSLCRPDELLAHPLGEELLADEDMYTQPTHTAGSATTQKTGQSSKSASARTSRVSRASLRRLGSRGRSSRGSRATGLGMTTSVATAEQSLDARSSRASGARSTALSLPNERPSVYSTRAAITSTNNRMATTTGAWRRVITLKRKQVRKTPIWQMVAENRASQYQHFATLGGGASVDWTAPGLLRDALGGSIIQRNQASVIRTSTNSSLAGPLYQRPILTTDTLPTVASIGPGSQLSTQPSTLVPSQIMSVTMQQSVILSMARQAHVARAVWEQEEGGSAYLRWSRRQHRRTRRLPAPGAAGAAGAAALLSPPQLSTQDVLSALEALLGSDGARDVLKRQRPGGVKERDVCGVEVECARTSRASVLSSHVALSKVCVVPGTHNCCLLNEGLMHADYRRRHARANTPAKVTCACQAHTTACLSGMYATNRFCVLTDCVVRLHLHAQRDSVGVGGGFVMLDNARPSAGASTQGLTSRRPSLRVQRTGSEHSDTSHTSRRVSFADSVLGPYGLGDRDSGERTTADRLQKRLNNLLLRGLRVKVGPSTTCLHLDAVSPLNTVTVPLGLMVSTVHLASCAGLG